MPHSFTPKLSGAINAKKVAKRKLVKFDLPPCKVYIELGYSIDYDDEIDEYDRDEQGRVLLINGRTASWEEVKANGFDYIAVTCEDEAGKRTEILSLELV